MKELPERISYEEAANRYGCDQSTIRRARKSNKFKSYSVGRRVWIDVDSADQWYLKSGEAPPPRKRRG